MIGRGRSGQRVSTGPGSKNALKQAAKAGPLSCRSSTWMNIDGVLEAVKKAKTDPLTKAARLVENDAKSSMKAGGRTTGPRGGRVQVPSTPPAPPHVQTGNLRASIQHAITEERTAVVGPTMQAPYGKVHEFGLRPFMRPAFVRVKDKFAELFRQLELLRHYRDDGPRHPGANR